METKKNNAQSAEKLRMPLALTGLLFTGGLVLASFTFVTPVTEELENNPSISRSEIQYVQEDKKDVVEPQPQERNEYVAPPQPIIIIDSNIAIAPNPNPPIDPPVITGSIGRTITVVEDPIDFPDVDATFPGGQVALQKFIVSNVSYPEISIDMNEQGKVYLSFIVEKDGSISSIDIQKGVSKDLDREAKRVLRSMPNWNPGEVDGRKVRTRCSLPIVFTLN